eukprot:gene17089-23385_t
MKQQEELRAAQAQTQKATHSSSRICCHTNILANRHRHSHPYQSATGNTGEGYEAAGGAACSTSADPESPLTAAAASAVTPTSSPIDTDIHILTNLQQETRVKDMKQQEELRNTGKGYEAAGGAVCSTSAGPESPLTAAAASAVTPTSSPIDTDIHILANLQQETRVKDMKQQEELRNTGEGYEAAGGAACSTSADPESPLTAAAASAVTPTSSPIDTDIHILTNLQQETRVKDMKQQEELRNTGEGYEAAGGAACSTSADPESPLTAAAAPAVTPTSSPIDTDIHILTNLQQETQVKDMKQQEELRAAQETRVKDMKHQEELRAAQAQSQQGTQVKGMKHQNHKAAQAQAQQAHQHPHPSQSATGNQGEEDEASDSPCSTSADPASPPTAAAASDVSPTSTPIDTASTRVTSSEVAPLTDSAVQIAWEYLKPSRKDFTQSTRHRQLMENPQSSRHRQLMENPQVWIFDSVVVVVVDVVVVAPLTDSTVQIAWEYLKPSRKDHTQSTGHRQLMENPQAFGKSHSSGRPASACGSGSASAITRPWSAATTMSRNPMPSRPFSASPNISYTTPARPISASNGKHTTADQATAASAHATSPPNSARNSDQAANASAHATSPPNSARHSLFAQAQNSVPNSAMNSSFAQAPNSAPNTSRNSSLSQSPNSAMNSSFAQAPSSAPNTSRNSSLSQSPNSDMDSSFSQAHNSAPNTSRNSSSSQVQNSAPNTDRHSSSSFSFTARPLSASPSFSNQTATSRPFSATAPSTSQRSTSLSRQRPMSAMPHSKHASFNFRATHLNQQSQPQPTSRTFTSAMPGFASSSLGARNSGRPVSAYRARGGAGPGADFLMNGAALGSSMHLSPRPQSGKVHK